jgi:hypothetical protein
MITKRHHLLSYHRVREAIAAGYIAFHWIESKRNPSDILSKHWDYVTGWPLVNAILFWRGDVIGSMPNLSSQVNDINIKEGPENVIDTKGE